jgi:hypothetical protein
MGHGTWPAPGLPPVPGPAKRRRPRTNAPHPCNGLTEKPHGALGEQAGPPPQAPPLRCGLSRYPRPTGARVRSTPRSPFVPLGAVTTGAGEGWATYGPRAIPAVARGVSSPGLLVRATSWKPTGRSAMANRRPWRAWSACWPAWRTAWASAPRHGGARSPPTRCCSGWARRRHSSGQVVGRVVGGAKRQNQRSRGGPAPGACAGLGGTAMAPESKLRLLIAVDTRTVIQQSGECLTTVFSWHKGV